MLVYCGRDVQSGRCAGAPTIKKRQKDRKKKNGEGSSKDGEGCSTVVVGSSKDGEGSSKSANKVTKKGRIKRKSVRAVEKDKNVCGFRLFASWMSTEMYFQIKSLKPKHRCSRNYNLGSLVTYKWIAHHYAKELIADPFIPLLKMKADIRARYHLNVSVGQCLRAKQRALFDYEGGLKEHYARIWEYRNVVLDTNPGSTCRVDDEETSSGNIYFRRFYVCFKGVRDGWFAGCRKVLGLDGCFLKHTCKGELLVAMGRDANNQMYPIAWAVVKVENHENWCWFLGLLCEDLQLHQGNGITIISDSHKGLLDAVGEFLPHAEHRKCTRHVFANFKRKFSGVELQALFWQAASTTLENKFYTKMDEIKQLSPEAYDYLLQRDPNSWSRAFFSLETKCASFENGICESFNRAILEQRTKPLITMLEDIRLYVMQRLVSMNRVARKWEDTVTPSVRKRLNFMMDFQKRYWDVIPSGFQELEVRSGNEAFGVNITTRKCMCRMWELSGIPCIHAVAAYAHLGRNPEEGVHEWYSQERWFQAYQFSIRPVYSSTMWKRTRDPILLPPLIRRMPGRPKKKRFIAPSENNSQVSRMGRIMTCSNCQEKGHNKASCKKKKNQSQNHLSPLGNLSPQVNICFIKRWWQRIKGAQKRWKGSKRCWKRAKRWWK